MSFTKDSASSTDIDSQTDIHKKLQKKRYKKNQPKESQQIILIKTLADIANHLIELFKKGKEIKISKIKSQFARKNGLKKHPRLCDILNVIPIEYRKKLQPFLKNKPIRSASGIVIVAVMCKPHRCPHIATTGNICIYCPGGPDSDFEYSTQSYTGYEPTSMRAIRARYNPYIQVKGRIKQLKSIGHDADKVEFIIMGGTFMSLSPKYRDYFIRNLHDALSGHVSHNVAEAVKYSAESQAKCIGITIETRPDYCKKRHLKDMLDYGCTRLEVGVQSIYEDIARDTNRGHTIESVKESFRFAKDCGFKIVAHMMPDLPNMGVERDLECFKEYFQNPDFRTDGLKLYPTMVIRGTGLYEMWKNKKYRNYQPEALIEIVAKILAKVPPWVRVYRIQRDIPMPLVSSGVDHGNLRELALRKMKDMNLPCRDLRTREVGIKHIHQKIVPDQVEFIRRDYFANGGWETFLSYEDPTQDILIGMLRLRKLDKWKFKKELAGACSMVRELHVYGTVVPIHCRDPTKFQHQGYGQMLMEQAEIIALEEHFSKKMAVIAGVGTRNYYAKLGYYIEGPYMVKMLLGK